MRDHTRIRAVELVIEPTVVETENVLNGLIRALRDVLLTSAFSLQPKHLSSYERGSKTRWPRTANPASAAETGMFFYPADPVEPIIAEAPRVDNPRIAPSRFFRPR